MPNNEWAVQRRTGDGESRVNNVIYIGRASFRMEPGPLLDDEVQAVPLPEAEPAADDQEPPYLRLRTLVDESLRANSRTLVMQPETPMPDLTGLAVEEIATDDVAPPPSPVLDTELHAVLDAVLASSSAAPTRSRLALSRARLAGLGVLAFAAGLLTAAGARVFATPAPVPAPTPALAEKPSVAPPTNVPANAAPASALVMATAPVAVAIAPLLAEARPLSDRAAARAQARGASHPRSAAPRRSTAGAAPGEKAAVAIPTDDRPAPRGSAAWVDPFAE